MEGKRIKKPFDSFVKVSTESSGLELNLGEFEYQNPKSYLERGKLIFEEIAYGDEIRLDLESLKEIITIGNNAIENKNIEEIIKDISSIKQKLEERKKQQKKEISGLKKYIEELRKEIDDKILNQKEIRVTRENATLERKETIVTRIEKKHSKENKRYEDLSLSLKDYMDELNEKQNNDGKDLNTVEGNLKIIINELTKQSNKLERILKKIESNKVSDDEDIETEKTEEPILSREEIDSLPIKEWVERIIKDETINMSTYNTNEIGEKLKELAKIIKKEKTSEKIDENGKELLDFYYKILEENDIPYPNQSFYNEAGKQRSESSEIGDSRRVSMPLSPPEETKKAPPKLPERRKDKSKELKALGDPEKVREIKMPEEPITRDSLKRIPNIVQDRIKKFEGGGLKGHIKLKTSIEKGHTIKGKML